jgi:nicotinamidase-related amidase
MMSLRLRLQTQELTTDAVGHAVWERRTSEQVVPAAQTGVIVCDMWDRHWSRGATERVAELAARMNPVLQAARAAGLVIVHAPSETISFYAGSPARQRMLAIPRQAPPALAQHPDPPLPIDDSDGGSDTGEQPWYPAWTRQHPAIVIDPDRDYISDDGEEIYGLIRQRGVQQVLFMGVHTNMCVLNRSFGIKQLVRWGLPVALVRDLTDAMYNPASPPYVSHAEGTRLVIEYIEKFWCPSLTSAELCAGLVPGAQV